MKDGRSQEISNSKDANKSPAWRFFSDTSDPNYSVRRELQAGRGGLFISAQVISHCYKRIKNKNGLAVSAVRLNEILFHLRTHTRTSC